MDTPGQRGLEFLTGAIAGGLLAGYGYIAADRLLRVFLGVPLPDLVSAFGAVVVLLVAVRVGQFRVAYWEARREDGADTSVTR